MLIIMGGIKSKSMLILSIVIIFSFLPSVAYADTASKLTSKSGPAVYDFELAAKIFHEFNSTGCANMIFILGQCYSGGFLDDLKERLKDLCDVAIMSSSNATKTTTGETGGQMPQTPYLRGIANEMIKTGSNAVTMGAMAQAAEDQNPHTARDQPLKEFLGNGRNVTIGRHANGTNVTSKHAILWGGNPNMQRHWFNLNRSYWALRAQGLSDGNIIVLFGSGRQQRGAPHIDGRATKDNLWKAIENISKRMNKSEQFLFWSTDHGTRRISDPGSLRRLIDKRTKEILGSTESDSMWPLDDEAINDMRNDPENVPSVGLIIDPNNLPFPPNNIPFHFGFNTVFFNGRQLPPGQFDPIFYSNPNPDLDLVEMIYPLAEDILQPRNLIEVRWDGPPEFFVPYIIEDVFIGTGDIGEVEVESPTTTTSTTTTESTTTTTTSTTSTTTTIPACTDPEIEVSADKPQYTISDRMNIGLKVTNQRCSVVVDILIILERPLCVNDNRFDILENRRSVTLPSGFDFNNPTWKSLILPPIHWGEYTLRAFLKDPVTGKTISQSEATFSFGNF
jgi:hypothetical protein